MTDDGNDRDYLPEDTVGDQWRRDAAGPYDRFFSHSSSAASLHERIAQLAYILYLRRGQIAGHDLDDWLTAERVLLSRFGQATYRSGDQFNGAQE